MKYILVLILLLLTGIVRAHQLHDQRATFASDQNATVTENLDEEIVGEHAGVEQNRIALQNALVAFGINDTELNSGQIICPPSNLSSDYKRTKVVIGVAGCLMDPLISQYTVKQRQILKAHDEEESNCSETVNLAGYLPPIAGIKHYCYNYSNNNTQMHSCRC